MQHRTSLATSLVAKATALCAILLAYSPVAAEPQKVTLSQPAMPLSRLLPKLSQIYGQALEADSALQKEVVVVSVNQVDSRLLLKKIEECTSGKWQTTSKGLKLCLLPETDRLQRQMVLEPEAASIQRSLDYFMRLYGPKGTSSSLDLAPGDKSGVVALCSIPSSDYLRMEPNSIAYFAYPPASGEKALPRTVLGYVQSEMAEATKEDPIVKIVVEVKRTGWKEFRCFVYGIQRSKEIRFVGSGASFVLNKVKRTVLNQEITEATIQPSSEHLGLTRMLASAYKTQTSWNRGTIQRCQGEIYDVPPYGSTVDPLSVLSEDSFAILKDPVSNEPLELAGGILRSFASSQQANLVACLPDCCLGPACEDISGGPINAGKLADRMINEWRLTVDKADGWLIIKPNRPELSRDSRLNREALRSIVQVAVNKASLSLDEMAKYCSSQPDGPSWDHFESLWLYGIAPELSKRLAFISAEGDRRVYKFYGMLSDSQRLTLRQGRNLAIRSLTPSVRSQYIRAYSVLGFVNDPAISNPGNDPNAVYGIQSNVLPQMDSPFGELSATITKYPIFYGVATSGERVPINHRCTMILPSMFVEGQIAGTTDVLAPRIQFPSYQMGVRECVKLDLVVPSRNPEVHTYRYRYVLVGDSIDRSGQTYLYKQLDPEVIKWIEMQGQSIQSIRGSTNGANQKTAP